MGRNMEELHNLIKTNYPAVAQRINKHDEEQLQASIYALGENPGLMRDISEKFGFNVQLPSKYRVAIAKDDPSFMWLRKNDKQENVMNFIISKKKYVSQDQLSVESIKEWRNALGEFVGSSEEGSKMVINDRDLPIYDYTHTIDGRFMKEVRGIWEMTDDFLGGPFSTYIYLDETSGNIIMLDAFIYAPGKNKRNMMQQLDYIAKHVTFPTTAIDQ